jgi:hypothetical protein
MGKNYSITGQMAKDYCGSSKKFINLNNSSCEYKCAAKPIAPVFDSVFYSAWSDSENKPVKEYELWIPGKKPGNNTPEKQLAMIYYTDRSSNPIKRFFGMRAQNEKAISVEKPKHPDE